MAQSFKKLESKTSNADSTGSGFRISYEGNVVTNHHVVNGCRKIFVNGTESKVLSTDTYNDLALLKTNSVGSTATIRQANSELGEAVAVVGYPLNGLLGGFNMTIGNVSSLIGLRGDSRYLQITAPVQPGNSGGPLLDSSGNLIGVVVAKLDALRMSRLTGDIPQNVNFAINSEVLRNFLDLRKVRYESSGSLPASSPTEIARRARDFTVLVECWKASSNSAAIPPRSQPGSLPIPPITLTPPSNSPPIPEFVSVEKRLEYLKWLAAMSERLKTRQPNPEIAKEFLQTVWYESKRAGLDTSLVLGLIETNSDFQKFHVTVTGLRGYMGINPGWARKIGDGDVSKLFHMQTNLRFGCVLLRHFLDERQGDITLGLTDYFYANLAAEQSRKAGKNFPALVLANARHWEVLP